MYLRRSILSWQTVQLSWQTVQLSWQTMQTDAMLHYALFHLGFRTHLGFSGLQRVRGGSTLLYFANLHKNN